jgi:ergothioneine biosynthesis protein EgtB
MAARSLEHPGLLHSNIDAQRLVLGEHYRRVRLQTEALCSPLEPEDFVVQPIEEVSPPKWHLGHTTWFFETVILSRFEKSFALFREGYGYIFNSYYESFGTRINRTHRGTLSRPTVREVISYRKAVDDRILHLLEFLPERDWSDFSNLLVLGLNHEQQHQELLVTDIKCIFAGNPLHPSYMQPYSTVHDGASVRKAAYVHFEGGLVQIGHDGNGFAWDNERPLHRVFLEPYSLQDHFATNGEFIEFIEDGGYTDFRLWLSDGWERVKQERWAAPLYWEKRDGVWMTAMLSGMREVDPTEPVCHVSFYEADAFAKWSGKRLPTEAEWENAAKVVNASAAAGNFFESRILQPLAVSKENTAGALHQMLGDVWVWTASAYLSYPGFSPEAGALAEYNSKFMSNQMVLRGGSCATPRDHFRITYRNFFQPDKRWQFTGIRLAK